MVVVEKKAEIVEDIEKIDPDKITEETKQALLEKVLKEIEAGIESTNTDLNAFSPENWAKRYKPIFGRYKKFLQQYPDKFLVYEMANGDYILRKQGDEAPSLPNTTSAWGSMVSKAWRLFCLHYPKSGRNFRWFIDALPDSAPGKQAYLEKADAYEYVFSSRRHWKRITEAGAEEPPAKKRQITDSKPEETSPVPPGSAVSKAGELSPVPTPKSETIASKAEEPSPVPMKKRESEVSKAGEPSPVPTTKSESVAVKAEEPSPVPMKKRGRAVSKAEEPSPVLATSESVASKAEEPSSVPMKKKRGSVASKRESTDSKAAESVDSKGEETSPMKKKKKSSVTQQ